MTVYTYEPHPRVASRQEEGPATSSDVTVGINARIGVAITRAVGTMWACYLVSTVMLGWILLSSAQIIRFDPYPFALLLFLGNIVQLLLMFVIMVGQQVIGAAADRRAVQTFLDAEATLHECGQLQDHLELQDDLIAESSVDGEAILQECREIQDHLEVQDHLIARLLSRAGPEGERRVTAPEQANSHARTQRTGAP
jgi:uncharacterized membrane protein